MPHKHIPKDKWPQKGQPARNPFGRPRLAHCFSDVSREILAGKDVHIEYTHAKGSDTVRKSIRITSAKSMYHGMVAAMLNEALNGNVRAFEALANRTDGLPRQAIDITTKDQPLPSALYVTEKFTPIEIKTIREAIRKAKIEGCQQPPNEPDSPQA